MSKKAAEQMIEQNNQLREQLTDENKIYYEQLLLYIRTAGLFYDDEEIETLLLQILQDILSAQSDGQTAEVFFGKNPQKAADEMIHTLGKASWKEIWWLTGIVFAISSFFVILNALTLPEKGINMLVLVLNGLLSFLTIGIVCLIIHKSIYRKFLKGKVVAFLSLCLFSAIVIGLFILIQVFAPSRFTLYLPNSVAIFIIALLLAGLPIRVLTRNREDRRMWWPFIPSIFIMGLIGIVSRLPWTEDWMASGSGKITSALAITSGLIVFWLLTFMLLRDRKKE